MKISPHDCCKFALEIAEFYPRVLPPVAVVIEAQRLSEGWLPTSELGLSHEGHTIQLMSQGVPSLANILIYGFADPGEAVGGTGLLCLMKALKEKHPFLANLNLNWNFIPCLNMDDQPDQGRSLDKLMKTQAQEVDWLVEKPRPETSALLRANQILKPAFVFPLHDEWHCREEISCYMPVSRRLPDEVCRGLREILSFFGLQISNEVSDLEMGPGFLNMKNVSDIQKSTFHQFSENGLVFICEVPYQKEKPEKNVIAAQIAAGLLALAHSVSSGG